MSLRDKTGKLVRRLHHPRTTVRGRLALLYGGVFLASGIALLAIVYVLVDNALPRVVYRGHQVGGVVPAGSLPHLKPSQLTRQVAEALVGQQRSADLHSLLVGSSIALAVMTVASVAAGWLLAGRVLRPLRTIASTTQQISEDNLHQRLALSGPRDELRDLGDTIDGLLARLDTAFAAQQNFVANASHELRTPLALSRAMLQVALADPGITLDSLRLACEEAIETGRQQEQLIEALLTLARSQRGLEDRKPVDLAAVVTEAARAHEAGAAARGVHLDLSIAPALVSGDTELVERLVSNVIDNGLQYNVSGGNVRVLVDTESDYARFKVTNTGPQVSPEQVARLLQPFQRVTTDRVVGDHEGLGLGLSIVQAIVTAHQAQLHVCPGEVGGLDVEVRFHSAPAVIRNGRPSQQSDASAPICTRGSASIEEDVAFSTQIVVFEVGVATNGPVGGGPKPWSSDAPLQSSRQSNALRRTAPGSVGANASIGPWISRSYNRSLSWDDAWDDDPILVLCFGLAGDLNPRLFRSAVRRGMGGRPSIARSAKVIPALTGHVDRLPVGVDPLAHGSEEQFKRSAETGQLIQRGRLDSPVVEMARDEPVTFAATRRLGEYFVRDAVEGVVKVLVA